ncbi:hypothetical protein C8Q78DRAFT_749071 [Trametes maxima]|nr:hypothetical protein C8Q78DRAFT_749071 [Trametes maxima]
MCLQSAGPKIRAHRTHPAEPCSVTAIYICCFPTSYSHASSFPSFSPPHRLPHHPLQRCCAHDSHPIHCAAPPTTGLATTALRLALCCICCRHPRTPKRAVCTTSEAARCMRWPLGGVNSAGSSPVRLLHANSLLPFVRTTACCMLSCPRYGIPSSDNEMVRIWVVTERAMADPEAGPGPRAFDGAVPAHAHDLAVNASLTAMFEAGYRIEHVDFSHLRPSA